MIIDNHVHVGWYRDGYHSPQEIWEDENHAGVDEICVSSTSTCADLYEMVINEIKELQTLGKQRIHPILWLTPNMLDSSAISYMQNSGIKWEGIKIHPEAHKEWAYNRNLTIQAANIAQARNIPLMIHTGEDSFSSAQTYEYLFIRYPHLKFVLAHGKPLQQVISLFAKYHNIVIDTAFMQAKDVRKLVRLGFPDKMIFGTDTPINKIFFNNMTTQKYIQECIHKLRKCIAAPFAESILSNTVYF